MDAQDKLMEMREHLRYAQLKFGREAAFEDIAGNYELAERCRAHSVLVKKILAGYPPDDLFEMEGDV